MEANFSLVNSIDISQGGLSREPVFEMTFENFYLVEIAIRH